MLNVVVLDDKERYKENRSPVNHAILEMISYVLLFHLNASEISPP